MARKTQPLKPHGPGAGSQPTAASVMEPKGDRVYAIGELARELDITTRAIRFYEQKGLLLPARKGVARSYTRGDRARLKLILRGKNLGFRLEEIAQYLAMYDGDPAQMEQTRHLMAKVDEAVLDLQRKRVDIDRTLAELKDIRRQCLEHLKMQPA